MTKDNACSSILENVSTSKLEGVKKATTVISITQEMKQKWRTIQMRKRRQDIQTNKSPKTEMAFLDLIEVITTNLTTEMELGTLQMLVM